VIATLAGTILAPEGPLRGRLQYTAAIRRIEPDPAAPAWPLVVPGFVDLHVHGGGGQDVMAGEEAIRGLLRFHLRHGTTALVAATVTAPREDLRAAGAALGRVAARPGPGEAKLLGLHLEGPFISPEALGAQPPHTLPPEPTLLEELAGLVPLRVLTFAPEIDPEGRLVEAALRLGCRAQIGHTRCTFAQAKAALERGASGFTHLFNAMSGLHHREPGAAAAALALGRYAEIIPDLIHVHPALLRAAYRCLPELYGVTDATAAAGMPTGRYRLGGRWVWRRGDRAVLEDGRLAGSVLTMDEAFRRLVGCGWSWHEAADMLAGRPARYLGLADRGAILPERRADLLLFDSRLRLKTVIREGREVV